MSTFPRLKSGSVAQYPLRAGLRFATHTTRFLDGTEQRFPLRGQVKRRWVIRLELLEEAELSVLEDFFADRKGRLLSFTFTDPRDQIEYPDCSFESDAMSLSLAGPMDARTVIVVREN